jgi:WD40 repeat protein
MAMKRLLLALFVLLSGGPLPLPAQEFKETALPSRLSEGAWRFTVSSQGKLIATLDNGVLRVWERVTGRELLTLGGDSIPRLLTLTFSPDDTLLAAGGDDGLVRVWDVAAGKVKHQLKGHNARVESLAYSLDGKTLGSAGSQDARLWDARTGQELISLKWPGYSRDAVFSRDLRTLITTDQNDIVVWDVAAKTERVLEGHRGMVTAVALGPDDKTLISASTHRQANLTQHSEIRLWDVASGKQVCALASPFPSIRVLALSPNGNLLAIFGDDHGLLGNPSLRLIDMTRGRALPDLGLNWRWPAPRFSADGRWLLVGTDTGLRMWEVPLER